MKVTEAASQPGFYVNSHKIQPIFGHFTDNGDWLICDVLALAALIQKCESGGAGVESAGAAAAYE